ncbi:hypothetical protein [Erwinia phage vEam_PM_6]
MEIAFFLWIVWVVVLSVVAGISTFYGNVKYGLKKTHVDSSDVVCIAFWYIVVVIYVVKLVASWLYLLRRKGN